MRAAASTTRTPSTADPQWVRFHALRDLDNEDEVVAIGFFDGTLEELERSEAEAGYDL